MSGVLWAVSASANLAVSGVVTNSFYETLKHTLVYLAEEGYFTDSGHKSSSRPPATISASEESEEELARSDNIT
jgi:hypothetical protein